MSGESTEGRRKRCEAGQQERRRGILRIRYKKIPTSSRDCVSKLRKRSRWKRQQMGFINIRERRRNWRFVLMRPCGREHLPRSSRYRIPDWFWTCSAITAALNFQPAAIDYVRRTATRIEYPHRCLIAGISHDCVVSNRDCVFSYINIMSTSYILRFQRIFLSLLMIIRSKIICYVSIIIFQERFN